jgi:hypothetical protein
MELMTVRRPTTALAVLALVSLGCERDRSVDPLINVPEWTLTQELRIGSVDDPDYALTQVGGVLAWPDGGVWVVQPRDAEIRVYAPDGTFTRRVGRRGNGPGEFTFPGAIGWWRGTADSVWVADAAARRVSLFSADGEFIRSFATPPVELDEARRITAPQTFTTDGSAVGIGAYRPGTHEWGAFPILRYDAAAGKAIQEIGRVGRTGSILIRWQGQGIATTEHPISDAPIITYGTRGDRVFIVERSVGEAESSDSIRVVALRADGDTAWDRRFAYVPAVLPRDETDSLLEARITAFQQFARLEGRLSDREAERAYRESVEAPRFRPPISSVRIDPESRVWLEWSATEDSTRTWWILAPDGAPHALLRAQQDLDVRALGDGIMWVVETDEFDVPYLTRYRIAEPGLR